MNLREWKNRYDTDTMTLTLCAISSAVVALEVNIPTTLIPL